MFSGASFELQKLPKENTGTLVDTLVKIDGEGNAETWCTVEDLDLLFDTASRRWPKGWDLNKVLTAVREAEFD